MEYTTPTTNLTFTGTIDQLLIHCAAIDLNDLDNQIEYEDTIEQLMADHSCTRDDAATMIEEAKLAMIQEVLNDLKAEGKVSVTYNENGEELYTSTETKPKKKKK